MSELDDLDLERVAAGKDTIARIDAAADAHTAGMAAQASAFRTLEAEGVKVLGKASGVIDQASRLFGGGS